MTDLLEAFALARAASGRPLRLHFAGDGSARERLEALARERKLGGDVEFHGHLAGPDLRKLLARCHVVVAPTRSSFNEGLNKVVMEGVLSGRPVISTYACPAAFIAPGTVMTTEVDDPASLSRAIIRLATDSQAYAQAADQRSAMLRALEQLRRPLWHRAETYLCRVSRGG